MTRVSDFFSFLLFHYVCAFWQPFDVGVFRALFLLSIDRLLWWWAVAKKLEPLTSAFLFEKSCVRWKTDVTSKLSCPQYLLESWLGWHLKSQGLQSCNDSRCFLKFMFTNTQQNQIKNVYFPRKSVVLVLHNYTNHSIGVHCIY